MSQCSEPEIKLQMYFINVDSNNNNVLITKTAYLYTKQKRNSRTVSTCQMSNSYKPEQVETNLNNNKVIFNKSKYTKPQIVYNKHKYILYILYNYSYMII